MLGSLFSLLAESQLVVFLSTTSNFVPIHLHDVLPLHLDLLHPDPTGFSYPSLPPFLPLFLCATSDVSFSFAHLFLCPFLSSCVPISWNSLLLTSSSSHLDVSPHLHAVLLLKRRYQPNFVLSFISAKVVQFWHLSFNSEYLQ